MTAAAASASVARDPSKHTMTSTRAAGTSAARDASRVRMVRTRARASVSAENGMRARLAMRIGRLVQLRKASAVRVVRVTETIQ
eukprot:2880892-Pleurochrysis_carterae.AAC.1